MISSVDRIKWYGYTPGGGLLSPDGKYFLLQIPKNASTFLGNCLTANGWTFKNLERINLKDVVQLAVLRDPVDRWLSGFATYAALYLFEWGYGSDHFIDEYNPLVEKMVFTTLVFDDHTAHQTMFLEQFDSSNEIVYFDCKRETLVDSLSKYTGFDIKVTDSIIDNSREDNYDTRNMYDFFKNKLDVKSKYLKPMNEVERFFNLKDISLRDRIYRIYQSDFKLIETVKFYGT